MSINKRYRIDEKKKIIFLTYSGDIYVEDIEELEIELESNVDFSSQYDRIYDFRHCNFCINNKQVSKYIEFEKGNLNMSTVRKEIFLTNRPNHVAITMIYEKSLPESHKNQCFIASTLDAIPKILSNSQLDKNFLDRILDEIKITQPNRVDG